MSFFFGCSSIDNLAMEHFIHASENYKKEDYLNAEKSIDLAINTDSSNYDFAILKAKICQKKDNNDKSIEILSGIASKRFKLDTVNYLIGQGYFGKSTFYKTKKDDKEKEKEYLKIAISYYDKALNINNSFFEAFVGKQKAFHNLGLFDDALIILNKAISIFPDSLSLIYAWGVEKNALGDITGALIDLNRAIENKQLDLNEKATALRFRGFIYFDKDSFDRAISDLTLAIDYNPKDYYAWAARRRFYEEKGQKEKACEDYRKAADLGFITMYETIKENCGESIRWFLFPAEWAASNYR